MVLPFIIVIFKTTNLASKKVANVTSTVVLLVLVIICAALLLVFGTIANGKYFLHSSRFFGCKLCFPKIYVTQIGSPFKTLC